MLERVQCGRAIETILPHDQIRHSIGEHSQSTNSRQIAVDRKGGEQPAQLDK